jgi:hypothetical protein
VAKWVNRTQVAGTEGGNTTATYTFTQPAAGNLLLAVVYGAVTSTTPAGWTLVQSAVNNGGLYVFSLASAVGTETSFQSTHNGDGNYPTVAVIYEFPNGTSITTSAAGTNLNSIDPALPTVSGLSGTHLLQTFCGEVISSSSAPASFSSWSDSAVEDTDTGVVGPSGYSLGSAYLEDSALASWSPTAHVIDVGASAEGVTVALSVPAQNFHYFGDAAQPVTVATTSSISMQAKGDSTVNVALDGQVVGSLTAGATASLATTATIAATAEVAHGLAASRPATATITTTANRATTAGASRTVNAAIAATVGKASTSGATTQTATVSITATATVTHGALNAARPVSATITTTAHRNAAASAAVPATAGISAGLTKRAAIGSSVPAHATVTASATTVGRNDGIPVSGPQLILDDYAAKLGLTSPASGLELT